MELAGEEGLRAETPSQGWAVTRNTALVTLGWGLPTSSPFLHPHPPLLQPLSQHSWPCPWEPHGELPAPKKGRAGEAPPTQVKRLQPEVDCPVQASHSHSRILVINITPCLAIKCPKDGDGDHVSAEGCVHSSPVCCRDTQITTLAEFFTGLGWK